MDSRKAALCVLAAGILWGIITLFSNIMSAAGLSSFQISGVRMAVAAVGSAVWILVTDRSKFRIRPRDFWIFVGTGLISMTLFNTCFFACVQLSEVSVAEVLLYTSPVWLPIMSAVVFRERFTAKKGVALVLTFAGCCMVSGMLGGAVRLSAEALAVGLASGVFYACYSVFARIALERYGLRTVLFWSFAVGTVASLFLSDYPATIATACADPSLWLVFLGIGFVCTILPYIFYNTGLKHMETSRAGILATSEPLVGSLLGIFVFGDSVGVVKVVGMLLILSSVVILSLGEKPANEQPS